MVLSRLIYFFSTCLLCSCISDKSEILRSKINLYYEAWNRYDFEHPDYIGFMHDSIRVWHGEKNGLGEWVVFDPNSGWKQWDRAWNGKYLFDSIHINQTENTITGRFRETNDFLKKIGMPEGFRAVVTYQCEDDKIKSTWYQWDESNPDFHALLKPIVEWGIDNDSATIKQIYVDEGFVPSTENAKKWKKVLEAYFVETDN